MDARVVDELARETASETDWRRHRGVQLAAQAFVGVLGIGGTVLGVLRLLDGELAGLLLLGLGAWILLDFLRDHLRTVSPDEQARNLPERQLREYWSAVAFFGLGGLGLLGVGLGMLLGIASGPWLAPFVASLASASLAVLFLRVALRYRALETFLRPGEQLIATAQGENLKERAGFLRMALLAATDQRILVSSRSNEIHQIPYEAVERFELADEKRSRALIMSGGGQDLLVSRIPKDRLLGFIEAVSRRLDSP